MINNIKVEVCCGSVDDCIIADRCHADRIELNHALELGGLTPSVGTLLQAKKHTKLPICCMVRPRGFGFCYSDEVFQGMLYDAQNLIENGADGIVFGFLHEDGTIDIEKTKKMVEVIKPKEAIFHKAFDSTKDLEESIQILIDCQIDRVLTSGSATYPNLEDGINKLAKLQAKYGNKIQILPGGGVRQHNVIEILEKTKCDQIHMTAKHLVLDPSTMHYPIKQDDVNHRYVATEENQLRSIMDQIKKVNAQ
ncbi:MAG: copper homeostasis protein CutC [Erysipelotrichaceae bacterium]|nr:copper homeostasis protein CutC [Erysipelotrichaceae bacterium]